MEFISYEISQEEYPELIEERIDKGIGILVDTLSRSYIQKLIKEGHISVNNHPVKANYRLRQDDILEIVFPPAILPDIEPEEIPLNIIYEDDDLLVVNKPKGMVVHPAPGHYNATLVNALLYHCKDNLSGINGIMRPGIVHRIDKDTTGSLLVCKNDFSHQHIANQLKEHSLNRKYHTIVHGVIAEDTGTINAAIGRHSTDRKKMAIQPVNGREAITHYKVIKRYQKYTYLECSLETGRTHQIRVHLNSIGHPVLGDTVYGNRPSPFSLTGQTLHAKELSFLHPRTGEIIHTDTPLPEYFSHLLEIL